MLSQIQNHIYFKIIPNLTPHFRDTLLYVLEHLHAVKELSEINQMNVENLAMMLGPTMSWTQDLANLTNMTTNLIKQNNVVGCLINEVQQLKMINK